MSNRSCGPRETFLPGRADVTYNAGACTSSCYHQKCGSAPRQWWTHLHLWNCAKLTHDRTSALYGGWLSGLLMTVDFCQWKKFLTSFKSKTM
jgi:hypothetical protein